MGFADALRIFALGALLVVFQGTRVSRWELRRIAQVGTAWGVTLATLSLSLPWLRSGVNDITSASLLALYASYPILLFKLSRSRFERSLAFLAAAGLGLSLFPFRSRSSLVSLTFALLLLALFKIAKPNAKKRAIVLLATLACVLAPVIYMVVGNAHLVEDTLAGIRVRKELRMGKRVDTGRGRIWPEVAKSIRQRPWFGWGSRSASVQLIGFRASAHNTFLHAWLEWGFVGLVLLAAILGMTLYHLAHANSPAAITSAAFLAAFLCRDSFEVAMFQNNSFLSLASWTVAGIGLLQLRTVAPRRRAETLRRSSGVALPNSRPELPRCGRGNPPAGAT